MPFVSMRTSNPERDPERFAPIRQAPQADAGEEHCATFSLVAVDRKAGRFGAAVASKYFAVGPAVLHLRQGVGACNTQSSNKHVLAERALARMAEGADPQDALAYALEGDDRPETRQLLAIDARARMGAYTGSSCTPAHAHRMGRACVAAGNTLTGEDVVAAMVEAFERDPGRPLGERLLAALEAGDARGGDSRGKQSAALRTLPVPADRHESVYVDIRVDDHPEPFAELRRLYEKRWQGK